MVGAYNQKWNLLGKQTVVYLWFSIYMKNCQWIHQCNIYGYRSSFIMVTFLGNNFSFILREYRHRHKVNMFFTVRSKKC